jgi:hypothetical protein
VVGDAATPPRHWTLFSPAIPPGGAAAATRRPMFFLLEGLGRSQIHDPVSPASNHWIDGNRLSITRR